MAKPDWTFSPAGAFEREFERLRRQITDAFGGLSLASGFGGGFPALNVYDQNEEICLALQVPGVAKDSLNVEMRENTLTISGRRDAPEKGDADILREESLYGEFRRSLRLPFKVKQDSIQAECKNGILTVRMPKTEESKPRHIAINA